MTMTNTTLQSAKVKALSRARCFALNKILGTSVLAVLLLSGCNMTAQPEVVTVDTSLAVFERMNTQCIVQVHAQQEMSNNNEISQYLSLANTAQYCVGDIQFSPNHPDIETAMQFSALAVVNFVKAGDIQAASEALTQFRVKFPQQDLLFNDYTSFVDTATVLVKQDEITPHQLTYLNINPTLRAEVTRQRRWSLN
jgi:hypothetical protein